ncbi:MAG: glycosyltransferase [Bacteroidales bacterium]|nr:glycosyltransferase [Bacteroidales bacterium]
MKKRIFIAIHYMEIGGAEISLVGLLHSLDYSRYDVDLFVYRHVGELMEYIPSEVRLLPEDGTYAHLESPVRKAIVDGYISLALSRLKARWQFRSYCRRYNPKDDFAHHQIVARATIGNLPSLEKYGEYDLAVSFLQPHNIVLEKVRAKKKICWIHTDYSTVSVNAEHDLPVWSGYDHIISISDSVTEGFLKVFPSLKEKIVLMHNILPKKFVEDRAEMIPVEEVAREMPKEGGIVNLLSVGRYSPAKNYDNVPDICRRIREAGCNVRWYIIGYGTEEDLIRTRIAETGMEGFVVLLGKKTNPYPYIKACDIYVQPSRYEGNSVTVREAQMLRRPVVVTNYPTAGSQVVNGKDGIIVPMDNGGCAAGIAEIIKNTELRERIEVNLSASDYSNEDQVKILETLIG